MGSGRGGYTAVTVRIPMSTKPNILLLFADDMRFDTVRALGGSPIRTPNLDALVSRGTSFTHAHIPGGTCGAICMPSRAMLHTGVELFHLEDRGASIPPEHTLMGEHLGRLGYSTYGIGKWHNGTASFNRGFQDGNEIMFGGMADHWNVPANTYDPAGRYDRIQPVIDSPYTANIPRHRIVDHITPGKHSTDLFAEEAVGYLEGDTGERPFFLSLAFMAPHDPRSMPPEYLRLYDPDSIPLPENFMHEHPFDIGHKTIRDEKLAPFPRTEEDTRRQISEYYAMITHLDDRIGDIIAKLKQRGQYENTLIVFAGDNGLALGRHGLFGKQNLYDHSVRVPLIFAGPGIPENRRSSAYVFLMDIFPTLCDIIGAEIPESVESVSFIRALTGDESTCREHLYTAYVDSQRAVRRDEWKLIRYNIRGRIHHQLFNIAADPMETANLFYSSDHHDKVESLGDLMKTCGETSGEKHGPWGRFWGNDDA